VRRGFNRALIAAPPVGLARQKANDAR